MGNKIFTLSSDESDYIVETIKEGNINFHLDRGDFEHTYFVDSNNEFATCQCGRLLRRSLKEFATTTH